MLGKRQLLKILGGGAAALTAGAAEAPPSGGVMMVWGHGASLFAADPRRIERISTDAFTHKIRGASFSANRLLVPFPLPASPPGRTPRIAAVVLRFRAESGAFVRDVALHDGEARAAGRDGLAWSGRPWSEERLEFPAHPAIRSALGLSFGVSFAATERELEIGAIGVEFIV